jgi:hypothetical protein
VQRESAAPGSGASPNSKHAMEVIGSRVKCMFEVGTGRTGGKQWFAGTAVRPTSKGWAVVKFDDGDTKTMTPHSLYDLTVGLSPRPFDPTLEARRPQSARTPEKAKRSRV